MCVPGLVSPMLVSSPSDQLTDQLTCSETLDQMEDDPLACCEEYSRYVFSYLREAEVGSHSLPTLAKPLLFLPTTGALPAQARVHVEAARYHWQHAVCTGGLAGGGGR